MSTNTTLGSRRHAAQLHALEGVEREVRANDPSSRRKYLRDFSEAFQSYESILTSDEFDKEICAADVILVGDYHALPASQRFAAGLLERRAQPGDRRIVLGLETIFARQQHILDEWWRREIDADELRGRIRFDADWGYDWLPFYDLLVTAREHAEAIYGLDCMPREDLRKISARDRHAADKIAEIRQRHARAVILVLFGESHLAPEHLPRILRQNMPGERILTVLQNVDSIYWRVTGEKRDPVEAVKVQNDVVCVFNSTPLEKYESYRLCLSRWSQEEEQPADIGPTIYNLVDGLVRFLGINRYSSHNGTQPKFLVDLLPEVYGGYSEGRLRQLLIRAGLNEAELEAGQRVLELQGSLYLPEINAFYVSEFQMMFAAEAAARFLHHACRGLPRHKNGHGVSLKRADRCYVQAMEHALAYCGSRILYPARPAMRFENGSRPGRPDFKKFLLNGVRGDRERIESTTRQLGYVLGSELYDAYVRGCVSSSALRRFFMIPIDEPGQAREACREIIKKLSSNSKKPCGSERG